MHLNIQGLELLCKENPCLSEVSLVSSWLTLKHNRYELLPNLSCSNVSSCLIGAISPRICWGFFLTDVTLTLESRYLHRNPQNNNGIFIHVHQLIPRCSYEIWSPGNLLCPESALWAVITFLSFIHFCGLWMHEITEVQGCW
uniref:Uncharacterized protein n=1 Tax=Rousettus aegyptiacus TaxID=9407 RepID=A0A7J8IMK4_ROUAE|nr:hypothetical protein HJG63_010612 [Rousettus aegyptiacus]